MHQFQEQFPLPTELTEVIGKYSIKQIMKQRFLLLASWLLLHVHVSAFQLPNTKAGRLTTSFKLHSTSGEDITIEQYSRCLSPYEEKQTIKKENRQYSIVDAKPTWQRILGELHQELHGLFCLSNPTLTVNMVLNRKTIQTHLPHIVIPII
jgi:hypothetical protein